MHDDERHDQSDQERKKRTRAEEHQARRPARHPPERKGRAQRKQQPRAQEAQSRGCVEVALPPTALHQQTADEAAFAPTRVDGAVAELLQTCERRQRQEVSASK